VFYLFVSKATNANSKGLITEVTGKDRGSAQWKGRPVDQVVHAAQQMPRFVESTIWSMHSGAAWCWIHQQQREKL